MKVKFHFLLVSIYLFLWGTAFSQDYYWSEGIKHYLELYPGRQFILTSNQEKRGLADILEISEENISELKEINIGKTINTEKGSKISQSKLFWAFVNDRGDNTKIESSEIIYSAPSFKVNDKIIGLSQFFYVKLKDEKDFEILDALAKKNAVEIVGSDIFMPLWYILSCDKNSKGNSLEMSNLFYESGNFEYSDPDFMEDLASTCSNDPLFDQQWYLNNTGQAGGTIGNDIKACQAWNVTTGCSGVIVAIVDNGLEFNHPDFNNINSSMSFDTENGSSPSIIRGSHGVPVAGIVGATRNNGIGISGIAPDIQLMSISTSLANNVLSRHYRGVGINWAWQNGAAIINNSWAASVNEPSINNAIQNAVNQGRNGLGTIVIFSSGNGSSNSIEYPSNNPLTISVGAINRNANRANFSNFGTGLDVVAPGVSITTTDRQGSFGENTNLGEIGNFTTVEGTSYAAPQVAGIAALILSVNPNLTLQQVRNAIESSAEKVGNYTYTLGSGEQPNLTWNNQMGYGRVSAIGALQAAFPINGPSLVCSTGSYSIQNLPAGRSVTWSSSNPSGFSINPSSGHGTRLNNFSGPVTLTVTISGGCTPSVLTRNIWIGTPHITNMRVNNQPVFPSQSVSLCPGNHFLNVTPMGGNAGTATWTVPSGVPHWIGNNTMDFNFPPSMTSIVISTRASNSCGQGANYNFFLTRQNWNCPSSFAVSAYPNPTSEILNIEMIPLSQDVSKDDAPIIESAILLNSDGKEVSKGYREGTKIVFDVSILEKGVYFIHVTVDGKLIREQILIE